LHGTVFVTVEGFLVVLVVELVLETFSEARDTEIVEFDSFGGFRSEEEVKGGSPVKSGVGSKPLFALSRDIHVWG